MSVQRLTYIQKRTDLSVTEFRHHWRTTHAMLAARRIPAQSYRQHHVVERHGVQTSDSFTIDGIVELSFDGTTSFNSTFHSDLGDLLEADERNFLGGFSGAEVSGLIPATPPVATAWLLSNTGTVPDDILATIHAVCAHHRTVREPIPHQHSCHSPILTRDSLNVIDHYPSLAVEIPVGSVELGRAIARRLASEEMSQEYELLVTEVIDVI